MRASWAQTLPVLDQGISGGSNFLAVLVVAGTLTVGDFGVFAMSYTVLTLAVGVSRSYFGVPIALAAHKPAAELHGLYSSSVSAAVWLAAPAAALVFGVGAVSALGNTPDSDSTGLFGPLVVAAATPLLVIQDLSRYYAIAKERPGIALASDSVWLSGIVLLFLARDVVSSETLLVGWVCVIVFCVAVSIARLRPTISMRAGVGLLRPHRGLRESLALSVLLATGVTLAMGFMMLPFLGSEAVGTIRGAGTVFGPINLLLAVLDLSILAQLSKRERSEDFWVVARIILALSAISVVWSVALLLLPPAAGEVLLGETWHGTRAVLPITSIEYLFLCVAAGLSLVLKIRERALALLMNRLYASLLILGAATISLLAGGGVEWMAYSLLAGAVLSAVLLAASVWRHARVPARPR